VDDAEAGVTDPGRATDAVLSSADLRLLLPDDEGAFTTTDPAVAAAQPASLRYDVLVTPRGTTILTPRHLRSRAAAGIERFVHRGSAAPAIYACGPGTVLPAVVTAACPGGTVERAWFERDPRRRAAFAVGASTGDAVVKATRTETEGGRGPTEQAVLFALRDAGVDDNLPVPLGHGTTSGAAWSAESLVRGVPMDRTRRWWRRRHGRSVLDRVGTWLDALASATSEQPDAPLRERLPLHASIGRDLEDLRAHARDISAVWTHGDLASGGNIVVRGATFTVIDWETARPQGLPLVDLVPTLCLGSARLEVGSDSAAQAAHVVQLCRGEHPRSDWLLGHVATYAAQLGLDAGVVGLLATLAWGYQASMKPMHDDLVRAGGANPVPWTSPAELVLARWMDDPALGVRWTAYSGRGR
jgi:hypothetical protein